MHISIKLYFITLLNLKLVFQDMYRYIKDF